MADRTELAFLKNALSARALDPQEQTALENLMFQRLVAGNLQIDVNGQITGGGLSSGSSGPANLVALLDGTVTAPSLSFVNEPSTGRYRITPGDIGESVNGVKVLDWSSARLQLTGINLFFGNDTANDIGAVGASRPRDLFVGRNTAIAGTLNAGPTTLGSTLNVTGTTTLGPLLFAPDLTSDIGASGASRPRNLYLGNNAVVGGTLNVTGATVIGGSLTLTTALPPTSGGTGTAYFTVVGPTLPRTYTFPDANATVLTSAAAVTVPQGGTGLTSGNAGGLAYFPSASTMASSAAMTAGYTLTGGGAAAPVAVATGAPVHVNLSDVASQAIDCSKGTYFTLVTTSAARTLTASNGTAGQKIIIEYYAQTVQSSLTLSNSNFSFGLDIPALTPTQAGHIDYIGCITSSLNGFLYVIAYTKV